ncbi:MAG TPA: SMC family ATPase [Terriglobales bacterium]|nr:SMC family ATPase [Terriglobales bacterium]
MYLQSIQLENYRRFKFAQTDFPDGIVGIIGNNGAGKSTLMEAIAWALYGNEAARTGKEEIKRLTAKPQEVSRVILDFELQGENYQVVRELRGNSMQADASVLINGKVVARGVSPVNDLIEKSLDMDYRAFITSFYAPQKELNVLSDFPPYKRKEVLARMLGIERIDTALKSLRTDTREIELKAEVSETHLKDINELNNKKEQLLGDIKNFQQKINGQEKNFQVEGKKLKQDENELKDKKEESETYHKYKRDLSVKEVLLSELRSQITKSEKEIETLEELTPELEKLDMELKDYSNIKEEFLIYEGLKLKSEQRKNVQLQIDNLLKSINSDKIRLEALESELSCLEDKNKSLEEIKQASSEFEEQLEKTRSEFIVTQSAYKVALDEQTKVQSQLENIEKLGPESICDRCLRPFGADYPKIREHLKSELNKIKEKADLFQRQKAEIEKTGKEIKEEKSKLQEKLEILQKEIEKLFKDKGEQESLKKSLKDKETSLVFLQENLKNLGELKYDPNYHLRLKLKLDRMEKLKEKQVALNQEKGKVPQLKENLSQLEQNLKTITGEIEAIKRKLKLIYFSEDELKNSEKRVEETRSKVHLLELNLKDLHYQRELVSLEMEKTEKEIEENQKLKDELKSLGEERLYLEKLDVIMTDFKASLLSRIRPTLSRYANELFVELTEYRYEKLELAEESSEKFSPYDIIIWDQGQDFSIEHFSGGEKDLANLCLRLAISLLISESSGVEFSFIILDEIFGSQDASRKENILKGLAKLKNRFRQIFLITHIDDIKDSVENLITVLENEDGTSQLILQ